MKQPEKSHFTVDLDGDEYRDRVYGCWQGKNAGGTLGTPLEEAWGQEEPFDVWWYPELQEGGLPNDDLEMQLVWLKALEEVGPGIKAKDLAQYWLDHIGYNFDEYGLSKQNLKWGLEPPISGNYNNWFVDCMGSPIRSEIWACVAPGSPRVAVRYAYEDAICDHAGGEGVYGEMFNAALESAAFVIQDPALLIDIALSYIPRDSQMYKAVTTAVEAHKNGLTWKEARRAVLDATPHYNAQYSPINTAFQVIGLLYGKDFGESICITVNCGYDTDSSGAAIGSYLGITQGRGGLPQKWVEPLGTGISTNESWGGVKNLSKGDNPVPTELDDLVDRITVAAKAVLLHNKVADDGVVQIDLNDLYADESALSLLESDPNTVISSGDDVDVAVEYPGGPVLVPGVAREIRATFTNHRLEPLNLEALLEFEGDVRANSSCSRLDLEPGESGTIDWTIEPITPSALAMSNRGWIMTKVVGRPLRPAVPVVLVGAFPIRLSKCYAAEGTVREVLDREFDAEQGYGSSRGGTWTETYAKGHSQPVADAFTDSGVVYLQTFVRSPDEREVWVVIDPSCPIKYWVNGQLAGENTGFRLVRPNQHAAEGVRAPVTLKEGWNEVLVKLFHDDSHPAPELYLSFSGAPRISDYQFDLDRTAFPWTDGSQTNQNTNLLKG